jgi:membrane protein implicated in regulation of membrane protease activity
MRMKLVFPLVAVFAVIALIIFSYIGEMFLGAIIAVVMFAWPMVFFIITKFIENRGSRAKEDYKDIKPDVIDGKDGNVPKDVKKEEEFVVPQKKDVSLANAREELEKLKKVSEVLDEEKNDGILSDDIYNELKKQNKEAIEKLEQEISKASGEEEEKKVYCRKGNHYISVRDCLPSKIDGYVICQEHNEEIRAE